MPSELYPSWTKRQGGPLYDGVVKERGTDAWLWHCHHAHPSRTEALACARARIKEQGASRAR